MRSRNEASEGRWFVGAQIRGPGTYLRTVARRVAMAEVLMCVGVVFIMKLLVVI